VNIRCSVHLILCLLLAPLPALATPNDTVPVVDSTGNSIGSCRSSACVCSSWVILEFDTTGSRSGEIIGPSVADVEDQWARGVDSNRRQDAYWQNHDLQNMFASRRGPLCQQDGTGHTDAGAHESGDASAQWSSWRPSAIAGLEISAACQPIVLEGKATGKAIWSVRFRNAGLPAMRLKVSIGSGATFRDSQQVDVATGETPGFSQAIGVPCDGDSAPDIAVEIGTRRFHFRSPAVDSIGSRG
jgi:hypothetical protein